MHQQNTLPESAPGLFNLNHHQGIKCILPIVPYKNTERRSFTVSIESKFTNPVKIKIFVIV